jgi:Clostripain family
MGLLDTKSGKIISIALLLTILLTASIPLSSAKVFPSIPLEEIDTKSLPEATKEWTIIQYNDADNELGVYARDDIREMMAVGSDSNVNMVVLYDTWAEGAAPYFIVNGGAYRIDPELYPNLNCELNMGSQKTVEDLLEMALEMFPADNYALVIWDHGDDFLGSCKDFHGPGIEEGDYDFLNHSELAAALKTVNGPSFKISVLAFDACICSMIEVAYDYQDLAQYLVAAQDYENYWSFPYDDILQDLQEMLTKDEEVTSMELSHLLVDDFMAEYLMPNGCARDGAFPAFTVVDLSQTDEFVDDLNTVTGVLAGNVQKYKGIIDRARGKANTGQPMRGWDADIDLYTFVDEVGVIDGGPKYNEAIEDIKSAWLGDEPFIYTRCSHQYSVKSAHGLGVYFPQSQGCILHNDLNDPSYYFGETSSGFNVPFAGTGWGDFLRAYFDL